MLKHVQRLLITIAACLLMGWLLSIFGLPAPYLLGSLLAGGALAKCSIHLPIPPAIPRGFHKAVVVGLSTLIGATFTPAVLSQIYLWAGTVAAMLGATLLATWAGFYYLRHKRRYDSGLALLCALPGGQAEVVAISRDLVEKDYVVAFCHLLRVVTVVCLVPLMLSMSEGSEGIAASYIATEQLPSIFTLPLMQVLQFIVIGATGYGLAIFLGIPIPHLLGPLLLSSICHLTGWVAIDRSSEFVLLAQITIGAAVGIRLGEVKIRELVSYFPDALCLTAILIATYVLIALNLAWLGGFDTMEMILAFIPGGVYEVTVLALIFGFDIAFVAFHHTLRVLVIFLGLPWLVKKLND